MDEATTGEVLMAAIGLEAFLGAPRITIGMGALERVEAIPGKIRTAIRRFLREDEFEEFPRRAKWSYDACLELMDPEPMAAAIDRMAGVANEEAHFALVEQGNKILAYLRPIAKLRHRDTPTGPEQVPPSDYQSGRFEMAWRIADDPLSILEDLAAGVVIREQGRHLRALYPRIAEEIALQIQLALIDLKADRASYQVPWPKEKQASALLGVSISAPGLAEALQGSFGSAKDPNAPAASPQPRGIDIDIKSIQTPSERATFR